MAQNQATASVSLTLPAEHLLGLAKQLAGERAPDARHLLLAFLESYAAMVERFAQGVEPESLRHTVLEELQSPPEAVPSLEQVLQEASQIAQNEQRDNVDVRHIGMALFKLRGIPVSQPSTAPSPSYSVRREPGSALQMGVNLTDLAREGKLPEIVARDKEIENLIETLCRPINPYAVLVGLEGVGRRAVVQGLAQRIATEKVPELLKMRPVVFFPQLLDDPNFYYALIEEASKVGAILYLEPFEGLISTQVPQLAILRMSFLSELVNRRVPLIGAVSSIEHFRQQVGRAPDLLKRFQTIPVLPLSAEESLQVLQQLAGHLAKTEALEFPQETLQVIVRVADECIHHRPFPDKAILLFDQAAGRVRAVGAKRVEPKTVWEVASLVTGLPIGAGEVSLMERLKGLKDFLNSRVIGQTDAIETISSVFSLKIRRLDLRPERPNGVFLFVGPTGVGKTETARAMAEYFFGSSQRMLRLDMNQFYESHTVARLLGAEFGYVGFEMGSPLLDFVSENPFCVVLLDEIEKAHEEIHKFFLQVFDDGYITDARGRRVSFSDTIIIMTSNLQPDEEVGFLRERPSVEDWRKAFRARFSPEFMNRIDAVCLFRPLQREQIEQIIRERLYPRLHEMYLNRRVDFELSPQAVQWLANKGFNEHYGARELERVMERELLLLLTPYVPLAMEEQPVHKLRVEVVDGMLQVVER